MITTVRLRASTRDSLKMLADKRNVSVEEVILSLLKKDISKQILISVDKAKYDTMVHLARLLKNTGYIPNQRLDDTLLWAFDYVMREVQNHIDTRIQSPAQPSTQQGMYGQPQGGQTV